MGVIWPFRSWPSCGDVSVRSGRPDGRAARVERVGRLCSLALVTHRWPRPRRPRLPVTPSDLGTLDAVVDFLRTHGPDRQLFPVVEREALLDGERFRGLRPEDLMVAWRDGFTGIIAANTRYTEDEVRAEHAAQAHHEEEAETVAGERRRQQQPLQQEKVEGDHGRGGVMLLIGGNIAGGKV